MSESHAAFLRQIEGDVTYIACEVVAKKPESEWGMPTVEVEVRMTNQEGVMLVGGMAEVELAQQAWRKGKSS